ncbi:MAG: hypothetical protein H7A42_09130 [Chlamydiales bacterium]|nr:hypothetical protein [Chlamydiales bacterium]
MTQKITNNDSQQPSTSNTQTVSSTDSQGREVAQVKPNQGNCLWNGLVYIASGIASLFDSCKKPAIDDVDQPVVLSSSKPKKQEAETLWNLFIQDPVIQKLPKSEQKKVFEKCLTDYQKSVTAYEKAAGEVAFTNPKAQKFAEDLSGRLSAIVKAYNAICEEENPSSAKNPLFTKEFMAAMRLAQLFGNDSTGSGSVGMSPLTIMGALKNGNLRERMTLAYRTVFSFFAAEILDKPGMIDKINDKLKEQGAGFQIDKERFEQDQAKGEGIITLGGQRTIKQAPVVDNFRNVEKKRLSLPQPTRHEATGAVLSEIPGLTIREARVGTRYDAFDQTLRQEANTRKLEWIPGKEWVAVDPTSTFAKETEALGSLPMLTGPSGTTDGFIHAARYLGLGDQTEEGMLACVGWMIPVGDHTLHEIRSGAEFHGVPYEGLPSDFSTFASSDPTVVGQINAKLQGQGLENPSHYFSAAYMHEVGRDLGVVDQIEVDLDVTLKQTTVGVEAYDLTHLNAPVEVQRQLKAMNLELRKHEAMIAKLGELSLSTPTSEKEKLAAIRERKKTLVENYEELKGTKMKFVKAHFQGGDRVYAMSNPRVLKAGTDLYTCNKPAKIQKIVYDNGFSEFTDPSRFHTGYATDYVQTGRFGMNEMGEIGHYFSIGEPGYMSSDSPHTLHIALNQDLTGTSIMSVTELKSAGFSDLEIEEGYRKIHQEYPYLQNDGLPPKDSEVVILRAQGNFNIVELIEGQDPYDPVSWTRRTIGTYAATHALTSDQAHSSWANAVVPTYMTNAERMEALVQQDLDGVTNGIVAFDHVDLDAPLLVKQELKAINLELRKLEATYTKLDQLFEATPPTEKGKIAEIRRRKEEVKQQYHSLKEKKVQFVKGNVSFEQQVYAMSNPRVLNAGTDLYTCNKPAKIQKIVFGHGFSEFVNPDVFHSGYATDYVQTGRFGMNEMGEIGHYFSIGAPGYMSSDSPHTLHISMNRNVTGTSIMSVTELESEGFTKEQIEEGYRKIHQDYPFLQNDGLPPKDSEVVILRPQGNFDIVELIEGEEAWDDNSWTRRTVGNYATTHSLPSSSVHSSWANVTVPKYKTEGERTAPQSQVLPQSLKTGTPIDANTTQGKQTTDKTVKVTN